MTISTVQYLHLPPGSELPPLDGAPFAAIIVIEAEVPQPWRYETSRWLVANGCRYMLAWGTDCSAWDDSVDQANQEAHAGDEIPDAAFVVTTWHDDEALPEVFWFARHVVEHPRLALDRVLIVHIAAEPREQALRDAFAQA